MEHVFKQPTSWDKPWESVSDETSKISQKDHLEVGHNFEAKT